MTTSIEYKLFDHFKGAINNRARGIYFIYSIGGAGIFIHP